MGSKSSKSLHGQRRLVLEMVDSVLYKCIFVWAMLRVLVYWKV